MQQLSRALLVLVLAFVPLLAAGCGGGGGSGSGAAAATTTPTPTTPAASTPVGIDSLLVSAGPASGGTKIELLGRGFFGKLRVMVGGREATDVIASSDGTRLTATVPAAAASITVADVVVISDTNGQAQAPVPFQYQPPPTLASVSPIRGPMTGGTSITLSGTNFFGTLSVSFGGRAATGVVGSPDGSRIVCVTPSYTPEGSVDVRVTSSMSGVVTAASGFTFFNPTPAFPPSITSVQPTHGTLSGGTQLTILGQNFRGLVGVTVGGVSCTNVFVNSTGTLLTCNTPVGTASGSRDVTVTNGDGTFLTAANAFTYDAQMTIASVSPASGPSAGGTLLTIDGTGFLGTLYVRVGGQPASSITVNGPRTRITCVSPPASQGATVNVEVLSDTNGSALAANAFTYVDPPLVVTSASPSSGPIGGGTTLTINGAAFLPPITVLVGGNVASNVTVDGARRRITCRTPPGSAAGPVSITVSSPVNGAATLTNAFTYNDLPGITAVTPNNGPQNGGAPITIMGSAFLGTVSVSIDGAPCSGISVNAQGTVITCATPPATNGAGAVPLVVLASLSGNATSTYTYNLLPSITAVAPGNGPIEGGTVVTLTGTAFDGTVNVTVDGVPATVTGVNGAHTQVTFTTPPGNTLGPVDIELSASLSGEAFAGSSFSYDPNPPPTITAVTPNNGPLAGGTPIVITGTNFRGDVSVLVEGDFATGVTVNASGTQVQCVTPPSQSGVAGPVTLEVISDTHGSIALGSGFTYNALPVVAQVTPSSGPQSGGNTVVIDGTGFGGTVAVRIGRFACTNVVVNGAQDQITCQSGGETSEGDFDVEVISSSHGTGVKALGYHFNAKPVIQSVDPLDGPLAGGTPITIDGDAFGGTVNVTIDGLPCANVVVNGTQDQITCVTPPATTGPGPKTIFIGSTTNGPASLAGAFTYNPTATIFSVTPANGPEQGGTPVTIDGAGFLGTVNVTIGAAALDNLVVNGAGTRINGDTPRSPNGGGPKTVIMVSDRTGVATLVNGFTYNPSPTIASVTPSNGPIAGGTPVVILGTNFLGIVTVEFGGIPAQNIVVSGGGTRIDCVTDDTTLAGAVDVTVTSSTNGTQVRTAGYTYVPPQPFFPSIVPNEGPTGTSVPVIITGFNLFSVSALTFGGTPAANITSNASGTIVTADSPPLFVTGVVDVVLTSATNGVTTSFGGYRYNPPPSISSVVPANGPLTGGNVVAINGSSFRGATTVTVGGVPATGVTVNPTFSQVQFTAPASATTGAKVLIVNSAASGSASSTYTYNPTPTVATVTPADGKQDGGDALTITGTNFLNTVTVMIDGVPATNVVPNGPGTSLTCNAPPAATGPGAKNVVVTSSSHGSGVLNGGYVYNPRPVITLVTPSSGPLAGTNNVTLDGTGFLGTVNVTIDNVPAALVSATSTRIIATVPPSTSGLGAKALTVNTSRAGPVTLPTGYTYNPLPTIAAVAPSLGSVQGGTTVVVVGAFFGGNVQVFFGALPATNVSVNASKTQVTCRTPAAAAGPVNVTVIASENGSVTSPNAFTYQPSPTITSITPNQGPEIGGTSITINGTNFGGTLAVDIEGAPCTNVTVNATRTRIVCTTGPSANGACFPQVPCKDVRVQSSTNGAFTFIDGFQYNPPPQIIGGVVPNNGPLEGNTLITINGSRFDGTVQVTVDGQPCTAVVVNGARTQVQCRTPAARAGVGSRDVVVFSSLNGPATIVNGFRYNEQLTVASIVPNEGPVAGGTTITITGAFFNPTLDPIGGQGFYVTIDGAPCTGLTVNTSNTVITCVTPPSPNAPPNDVGPKTVVVHSDRNGTAVVPNGFTYRPLPTLLTIDPDNGPIAGGNVITITGTDFRGTVQVLIGGQVAQNVTVNTSFSSLTAVAPRSLSGAGPRDVVINTTGAGSVTRLNGYTYNPVPTVILVNPNQGPVAGGNVIQIDGSGYRDTVSVSIDQVPCTNLTINVSGTSMTLTVPASTSGAGPKTLGIDSSRDGQAFFANTYTYRNTPTFLAIAPNNGPLAGGQAIAVTGTNFFGNVSVTIDGSPCTNVTVTALGDRIDCITPPSPSGVGAKNVVVNASAAGTVSAPNAYTYNPAPTATLVVPDNGPLGGGTAITITGTNFNDTVNVTIGGNACTGVTVNASKTQVSCVTPASTTGIGGKQLTVASSSFGAVNLLPGFTYNATPTITSLNPPEGPLVGGNTIFINGTDFRGTVTVSIDGQPCTGVTASTTFSFVSAVVPASLTGIGLKNVVVTASLAGTVSAPNAYRYNPVPTFTGISPDNGPQGGGTLVTITGTTFRGQTTVLIGGVPCTNVVVSGASDTITARTPPSATTGVRDVTVGCTLSGTVTQVNAWTYNASPIVTSIVPASGPEGGGTPIAITGTDFRGTVSVLIGGLPCTGVIVNGTSTRIDCVTPPSNTGPGAKDVQIIASLAGNLTVPNGFVYNISPGFVNIIPNEGPNQGGQQVLIIGTDFGGTIGVQFGPNAAAVNFVSPDSTRVTVTTPPFAGVGPVDVGINSSTNGNVTLTSVYTYNAPPIFNTITPNEGPTSGGTPIVIQGGLIRGNVQVLINGVPCTNVTVNATNTRIDCVTPPSPVTGLVSVTIVSSLNGTTTVNSAFQYNPIPTITQVVDNNGPATGGQTINIFGTGFGGTLNVTIDNASCTNVVGNITRDRITCVTPAATTGAGPKTLSIQSSTNGIVNLANGFTYNVSPTIAGANPPDGPAAGGQTVIITGIGFEPTVNVSFGAVPAQVVSVNATRTQVTVITPPLPNNLNAPQQVGITVSSTFTGVLTLPNAYTYNVTPTISNINPNNGPLGGGQLVAITGANFRGQVGVTFDGATAPNVVVNGTFNQITCRTPPGQFPSIPVDVRVTSSLNGSSTFPLGYTYNNTPSVAQVTPNEGPIAGNTPFLITGAGFVPTVNVIFANGFASGITVNPTFTQVTGNTPPFVGPFPGEFGTTVPVTVSSSGGGDIPVPPAGQAFTYNPTPTLLAVIPAQGPSQGGTLVELRGKFVGLTPGATVQVLVNGVPSTNVTWTSQDPTLPDNTLPVLPPPGRRNFDRLRFVSPPGPIGQVVPITIISSTHGTDVFPGRFLYNGPPTITQVIPNNGPMDGRTTVLIVGTGFDPTINVTVGSALATGIVVTNNTTISAQVPASAVSGAVGVTVQSSTNGQVTLGGGFTYNPTPTITAITPNNGPIAGNQLVTINGSGLAGTITITLGSVVVPTQNVTVSGGVVTVLTPPGLATGPVNVTVDSSQFGTSVVPNGYTYNGGATITLVTPDNGPVNATTPIVIMGTGFLAPSTVTIGGLAAGTTTVVSPTMITATAQPFTLVGAQDVVVSSPLAGIATRPDGFTYTPVFGRTTTAMPAGGAANDVASADFNGDGNADFVVANPFNVPSFSVLINGTRTDFPVAAVEPANLAVADMNLDGKPDVVVTNRGSNSMHVYLNVMQLPTSTPTFSAPVVLGTSPAPGAVEAKDLNSDGKPDIVLVSESTGALNVFPNTTVPGLGLSLSGFGVSTSMVNPAGFVLADFNRDGRPDLAVADVGLNQNRTVVFTNVLGAGGTSSPGFSFSTNLSCGNRTTAVAAGDLNGDGLPDIVAVNRQDNTISTFLHSSVPTSMAFAGQPVRATGQGPVAVAIVDLDGAGIPDVVTANDGSGTVSVLVNSTLPGSTSVTLTAPADRPSGASPGALVVVDANNDGAQDFVVPNRTTSELSILTNTTPMGTTPAAFAAKQDIAVAPNTGPAAVIAADFNLDGRTDFVVLNKNSNTLDSFTNTAPPNAANFTFNQVSRATGANPIAMAAGDLNCDGFLDLAVVTGSSTCEIYFNQATGPLANFSFNLNSPGSPIVTLGENVTGVAIADFNGDGKPDVAVALPSAADRVRVVANLTTPGSTGAFIRGTTFNVPNTTTNPGSLAAADMNGDGYPDIVTGNGVVTNAVGVVVNGKGLDGPSLNVTFTAQGAVAVGAGPLAVKIAQVTGSGHPDIVTVNNGASVALLPNTTAQGGTTPTFGAAVLTGGVNGPTGLDLGELNGDGRLDLATSNGGDNTAGVFLNQGGAFPGGQLRLFNVNANPQGSAIGDFNNDGRNDIVILNFDVNDVSILRNITIP